MSKYEESLNMAEKRGCLIRTEYNVLQEACEKAEAFDLMKEKQVNVFSLIWTAKSYKENRSKYYNDKFCFEKDRFLTEKEFNILAEVLCNE